MNSFSIKLGNFLKNKNVVTAISFAVIGVVLIFGYRYRIREATSPVVVPYAKVTIPAQTRVTSDMIGTISIARDAVNSDLIYTRIEDIKNLYTNLESTIYQGSFFYKNALTRKDNLPTSALLDIPEGHTLLSLNVNMKTTFYNSIVPGDYIDLYVKTIGILPGDKQKENEILVGKLIDKIKVLAVKTSNGENVFGTGELKEPAGVLFALPEEQALLLMKADYFRKLKTVAEIEFAIIPRGKTYEAQGGEQVVPNITSEQLEEYINDKTKDIDIKDIKDDTELGD